MKEISADTAMALKLLKFKEKTYRYYLYKDNDLVSTGRGYKHNWNDFQNRVSICSQSFLKKWLLKNHNIHIDIYFDDMSWQANIGFVYFPDQSHELSLSYKESTRETLFEDFEDFLELVLIKSLTLIK
tara:strand:+ start:8910 stop:9293 length:384 start_codon:yes stop_codon:yes gene_type:complete